MHVLIAHVPKLLRDAGSLAKFSQQGLETLNDDITKHSFKSTNHKNEEALRQIMLKLNHLEELTDQQHYIVPSLEKVSNNLIALVKQQLNVLVLSNTEDLMEVEGNDFVSGSLHQGCKSPPPHSSSYNQVSNFVDEYIDRERRKNIIIICNLPESNPDHPEQALNNTDSLANLVNNSTVLDGIRASKMYRIGKKQDNKTWPLLATLDSFNMKKLLWANHLVFKRQNIGKMFISPDLTPEEKEVNQLLHRTKIAKLNMFYTNTDQFINKCITYLD